MKKQNMRVLVGSDLHSGHIVGLTPPNWQLKRTGVHQRDKLTNLQSNLWQWWVDTCKKLQPIDLFIVNGDAIDGRGERSGSTELITADRNHQVDMATEAILKPRAKHIVMTYGTGYHTGYEEDFETQIAKNVKADKIGAHEWIDINGKIIDCKHHITSSSVPHGRHTAAAREHLWNILWHEHEEQPKADIIIRSHVHYFDYCGGSDWLALTTPALQGMGTKYGSRACSGRVDFGVVCFDINSDGSYTWQPILAKIPLQKAQVLKF